MSINCNQQTASDQPMVYQIRIEGHLDPKWSDWFEGLSITLENNGTTLLTGPVVDQAALYGLLRKVRDLGMPLLSVNRLESAPLTTLEVGRENVLGVKQEKGKK
jgi:hypothetical protein